MQYFIADESLKLEIHYEQFSPFSVDTSVMHVKLNCFLLMLKTTVLLASFDFDCIKLSVQTIRVNGTYGKMSGLHISFPEFNYRAIR